MSPSLRVFMTSVEKEDSPLFARANLELKGRVEATYGSQSGGRLQQRCLTERLHMLTTTIKLFTSCEYISNSYLKFYPTGRTPSAREAFTGSCAFWGGLDKRYIDLWL